MTVSTVVIVTMAIVAAIGFAIERGASRAEE